MPVKSVPAMCKHVVCFLAYLTESSCMPCSATCYLPANHCLSDLSKPCLACCLSGRVLQKLRASHYGLSYENFVQAMFSHVLLDRQECIDDARTIFHIQLFHAHTQLFHPHTPQLSHTQLFHIRLFAIIGPPPSPLSFLPSSSCFRGYQSFHCFYIPSASGSATSAFLLRFSGTTLSHTSLSHSSHTQLFHTQVFHTQVFHTQPARTTLPRTTFSHI